MAAAVGRLQRLLRTLGPDRARPRDHADDAGQRFFDAYEPVHGAGRRQRRRSCSGSCIICFTAAPRRSQPTCYLQDLFTNAAARGKGVGRALIDGVYERARLAGSPRVYWQTHETNHTAMQLYDKVAERSGFRGLSQDAVTPRRGSRPLWINLAVTAT